MGNNTGHGVEDKDEVAVELYVYSPDAISAGTELKVSV